MVNLVNRKSQIVQEGCCSEASFRQISVHSGVEREYSPPSHAKRGLVTCVICLSTLHPVTSHQPQPVHSPCIPLHILACHSHKSAGRSTPLFPPPFNARSSAAAATTMPVSTLSTPTSTHFGFAGFPPPSPSRGTPNALERTRSLTHHASREFKTGHSRGQSFSTNMNGVPMSPAALPQGSEFAWTEIQSRYVPLWSI